MSPTEWIGIISVVFGPGALIVTLFTNATERKKRSAEISDKTAETHRKITDETTVAIAELRQTLTVERQESALYRLAAMARDTANTEALTQSHKERAQERRDCAAEIRDLQTQMSALQEQVRLQGRTIAAGLPTSQVRA